MHQSPPHRYDGATITERHSLDPESSMAEPEERAAATHDLLAPLLPAGEPVEQLLRKAQFLVPGVKPSPDFREVHREGGFRRGGGRGCSYALGKLIKFVCRGHSVFTACVPAGADTARCYSWVPTTWTQSRRWGTNGWPAVAVIPAAVAELTENLGGATGLRPIRGRWVGYVRWGVSAFASGATASVPCCLSAKICVSVGPFSRVHC